LLVLAGIAALFASGNHGPLLALDQLLIAVGILLVLLSAIRLMQAASAAKRFSGTDPFRNGPG
jgi:hypothetical protein